MNNLDLTAVKSAKGLTAKKRAFAAAVLAAALATPASAYAAVGIDLGNIKNLLTGGIGFLGGVLLVFGAVNLGLTIKDGMQGGGGQLAGAIAMIVGGGIVIAASAYFGSLDTSWAS